jgi:phytoene/squalene synthetase
MRILDKIEARGCDVLAARPSISKTERVRLLIAALARAAFSRAA